MTNLKVLVDYKYRIFLNEAKDAEGRHISMWDGYDPKNAELKFVYGGEESIPACETEMDLLEDIFRVFNIDHPRDYRNRSLSVGDVVELVHQDGEVRRYAVDRFGFKRIFE